MWWEVIYNPSTSTQQAKPPNHGIGYGLLCNVQNWFSYSLLQPSALCNKQNRICFFNLDPHCALGWITRWGITKAGSAALALTLCACTGNLWQLCVLLFLASSIQHMACTYVCWHWSWSKLQLQVPLHPNAHTTWLSNYCNCQHQVLPYMQCVCHIGYKEMNFLFTKQGFQLQLNWFP